MTPRLFRAYSTLAVSAVDDSHPDHWTIKGTASTPKTNSYGDQVNPLGGKYTLPIPYLWQHSHQKPVGHVVEAKPGKTGIPVTIRVPKVTEPGVVKDRIDEAIQSVKYGLVVGLSLGLEVTDVKDVRPLPSGGLYIDRWKWLELSQVTIAADSGAAIQAIMSMETESTAASGLDELRSTTPGVSGRSTSTVVSLNRNPETMKTIGEQIESFTAARVEKTQAMEAIMKLSADSGETLDAEQSEQYDTLEQEVAALDKHLTRLQALEKVQASNAKSVTYSAAAKAEATAISSTTEPAKHVTVQGPRKLQPGVAFARYARVLGLSHELRRDPITLARQLYPDDARYSKLFELTAVPAGTSEGESPSGWGGALVGDETSVFADFVEFLRPQTILGRFGTDGIPSLRRVPFRVPLIGQSSGGDGYWVGEGKPKPLTQFDFNRRTLEPLKVANIAVATKELLRDSSPSAEMLIRDALAAALRERLDIDFIDPNKTASPGVSPASITEAAPSIPSSGTSAADVRADIQAIFALFIAANNAPTSGVWVMPATTALALSLMQNPLGQAEFPGLSMSGGTLFGLPVIVSQYVPAATAGAIVVLVNAQDIYLGDEGGISIDMSTQASLQMDNAPTSHSSDVPQATSLVSLWQTNSVGFLAERTINWMARRDAAVAYLTGVLWGAGST